MPVWQIVLRFQDPDPENPEPFDSFIEISGGTIVERRKDASGKRVTYFIMPEGSASAFIEEEGGRLKMTLRIDSSKAQEWAEAFKERYSDAEIVEGN